MTAEKAPVESKFPWYRSIHDGQVHPALRFPKGYEDQHPEAYEGVESYDPAKGDEVAEKQAAADAEDAAADKSTYVAAGVVVEDAPVLAVDPVDLSTDGSAEGAPSEGLTIPLLKEALDAKGIEYTSRETRDSLAAKLDSAE